MKGKTILYSLLGIVVAGTLFFLFGKSQAEIPEFESAKVQRGNVINTISVSGRIEPVTRVDLSFPTGGRVASLFLTEGEHVSKNATIAELDKGVSNSTLQEAESRVAHERAVLASVLAPLRNEERALKDTSVHNAEVTLGRAEESARVVLARAFVQTDDAVHESVDELFDNTHNNPEVGISFQSGNTHYFLQTDSDTESVLNAQRKDIESVLADMEARSKDVSIPVDEALTRTNRELETIQSFLTTLASVVNKYTAENTLEQTVYENFQSSVASARATVNTVRSEVTTAYTSYTAAVASLSLALRDLELSNAGASKEAILTQEASVASALAGVATAEERVNDLILTAPVEGVVSRINFKVGESVSPYEPFAELITEGSFEVEAYIPEADIARLKLGDSAEITFDAFEKKDIFKAEVVRVALSETIRDGVPTYKTTLRLLEEEREGLVLRPGMTADIEIKTDVRENVLYVPQRSVVREENRTYVRMFDGTLFQERDVKVGLRSSDGSIEIVSGLTEGEEVVIYVEES